MSATSGRPGKRISLQFELIAWIVTLTVLSLSLAGYLSFRNGQMAVTDAVYQLRHEITQRIKDHLVSFLETPHQVIHANAIALGQGSLSADDPESLERHFWQQIQAFDSVTSIYFGNTLGGLVNSGREGAVDSRYVIATDGFTSGPFRKYATDDRGNRTELLVTVPDFDARAREWYARAVDE
ncbi:MAG: hypothetical protein KOO61_07415, partial [Spirochaetales bacterium]|nr:hypothetical protein [Spirochaetales bacterium]